MTHFNQQQRISLQNASGWDFKDSVSSLQIAEMISKSSICPPAYKNKPYDIIVAIQFGRSIGLAWGYSLLNIAMINGRPTLWGDAMLALCKQSSDFEYCDEIFDEQSMTALCEVKRKGEKAQTRQFSKEDAIRAHLWGKNVWATYPQRMLQMRARSWALRDMFPHVLQGLGCAEEVQDYPESDKTKGLSKNESNVLAFSKTQMKPIEIMKGTSMSDKKETSSGSHQHEEVKMIPKYEIQSIPLQGGGVLERKVYVGMEPEEHKSLTQEPSIAEAPTQIGQTNPSIPKKNSFEAMKEKIAKEKAEERAKQSKALERLKEMFPDPLKESEEKKKQHGEWEI